MPMSLQFICAPIFYSKTRFFKMLPRHPRPRECCILQIKLHICLAKLQNRPRKKHPKHAETMEEKRGPDRWKQSSRRGKTPNCKKTSFTVKKTANMSITNWVFGPKPCVLHCFWTIFRGEKSELLEPIQLPSSMLMLPKPQFLRWFQQILEVVRLHLKTGQNSENVQPR